MLESSDTSRQFNEPDCIHVYDDVGSHRSYFIVVRQFSEIWSLFKKWPTVTSTIITTSWTTTTNYRPFWGWMGLWYILSIRWFLSNFQKTTIQFPKKKKKTLITERHQIKVYIFLWCLSVSWCYILFHFWCFFCCCNFLVVQQCMRHNKACEWTS